MAAPSLSRELFERIVTSDNAVGLIRGMINSDPPTTEGDHFDCKVLPPDPNQHDRKTRELWSEALGGFANAGGGVLIWGLEAKKRPIAGRDIDAVIDEKPIPDPMVFESRLRELHRGATDSPLGHVEIKAFLLPEDPGRGFVVCFVPEGEYKPYRSELAEQQYFLSRGIARRLWVGPSWARCSTRDKRRSSVSMPNLLGRRWAVTGKVVMKRVRLR